MDLRQLLSTCTRCRVFVMCNSTSKHSTLPQTVSNVSYNTACSDLSELSVDRVIYKALHRQQAHAYRTAIMHSLHAMNTQRLLCADVKSQSAFRLTITSAFVRFKTRTCATMHSVLLMRHTAAPLPEWCYNESGICKMPQSTDVPVIDDNLGDKTLGTVLERMLPAGSLDEVSINVHTQHAQRRKALHSGQSDHPLIASNVQAALAMKPPPV